MEKFVQIKDYKFKSPPCFVGEINLRIDQIEALKSIEFAVDTSQGPEAMNSGCLGHCRMAWSLSSKISNILVKDTKQV
jgi:hypothetical protein